MRYAKWLLIPGLLFLVSCTPKTYDGLSPAQPAYTGIVVNPLVIYDTTLAAGVSVTVFLPSPYDAAVSVSFSDTLQSPTNGKANMLFNVSNYSVSGALGANWVAFALLPTVPSLDLSSGNFTQMSFYAKANKSGPVNVNGGGSAVVPENLTTSWQQFTVPFAGSLTVVTQLFVLGVSAPNEAAPFTVYVDDLIYQ